MTPVYTVRKQFPSIPFAHRQPAHPGHCRLVHGHNWTISVVVTCLELDEMGFVVDFASFKSIFQSISTKFDHALVVQQNDPEFLKFRELEAQGLARVAAVVSASAEGLALDFAWYFQQALPKVRGVRLVSLTLAEDEKNEATVTL